ncbi:hypothetical protein PAXRUDRAFT_835834 [Paxillus rubicundulus Ve08.2h10]|uniref:Unplaced genomic scaffold scaffold_3599, whole genome shotgun sequence n=1 Tax=Paxillus rubicundulus Ve08.2h10 TaxID=930991 RepID=A0A0D0BUA9_9AGAM|nr:hypothetical protein PAXRUDRAFT_835834 [Paxillus rubicundulus Ve08.2h10]
MSLEDTGNLSMVCDIFVGMLVMVTENLTTAANLANGSRGSITNIILDPREPSPKSSEAQAGLIHLQYPPLFVILQLNFMELPTLQGLQEREVPLAPIKHDFYIGSNPRIRISRRQLPLTAAYAFTDFRSQGQTIEHVLVDIGKTVNFGITPFNAYVALSRSRGRDTIRLLRDFDNALFTSHPSEDLREEDARLSQLAQTTMNDYKLGRYGPISGKPHLVRQRIQHFYMLS